MAEIEFKLVDPIPAPEPWLFDRQGNLIGITYKQTLTREELLAQYPSK